MPLTVKKIIDIINGFAPFDLAENWDNSGLQAGDPDGEIQKIMVSLDVSKEVMEAARDWGGGSCAVPSSTADDPCKIH